MPVVDAPHMPDETGPFRTSLPSMFPPGESDVTACVTPPVLSFGFPPTSMRQRDERDANQSTPMIANTA